MTLYEEVRAALRESGFRPKKQFGQNFLIHQHVIESILGLLDLEPNDQVVEIGPVNATIHKIDEYVSLDDLERLPAIHVAIAERLLR